MPKNNSITYCQIGDYNIPNLILPFEEANIETQGDGSVIDNSFSD